MRLGADELGNLLRAHAYVQVQRPPQLWDVDTTGPELFIRAMGELLAAGLARNGNDLGTWVPGGESEFVSADLPAAMAAAGAVYAYSRRMSEDAGSVTALYRRFRQ